MKTFKEFLTEARAIRRQAKDLMVGDVIQPNAMSAKDVKKVWGEVTSVVPEGRDMVVTVKHVEFSNGKRIDVGTTETLILLSHQVMLVRVE